MFNTSRILRNAWTAYRTHARRLRLAKFDRRIFAEVLKGMWAVEKDAVAKAAADRAEFMAAKEARTAAPTASVTPATRADEINAELLAMDTATRRRTGRVTVSSTPSCSASVSSRERTDAQHRPCI